MTKQEIILANQQYLFPSVFHYYKEPLVVARAKDQFVWDADGNQYLDFFGGIVTISVGHSNDTVNRKVHEQIDKLQHVSTVFANEPQAALAKRIAQITPGGKLTKSFFTNSGTEANETAVLAARCYTGSHEIVALRHGYHGRSAIAMAATGQATWRLGGAAPSGFVHALNAYCYRCPLGLTYPSCNVRCARDMEEMIQTSTSGRIAAFIAEPIQGIGGFITPPKEYFEIAVGIVRKYGAVFICDEVQTGWGRTGDKWCGIEHWGVEPEIMTFAKSIANGFPVGATIATEEVANAFTGLSLSTFGGNPISMAAVDVTMDVMERENTPKRSAERGRQLRDALEEFKKRFAFIGDVRGMGLMQGIELVEDRKTKEPSPKKTTALLEAAKQQGLLIGKGGLYGNVLRIAPSMLISKADIDDGCKRLERALAEVK